MLLDLEKCFPCRARGDAKRSGVIEKKQRDKPAAGFGQRYYDESLACGCLFADLTIVIVIVAP